ncbi:MAG: flgE 2 [Firmicutes bacterium]|nr:flgE 2 [Bacillota bacterium]
MMRSLFAGVSGLKNHQTRMDVIGNNIANVNTVGFKTSRVNFQDVLSQTLQGASSAQGNKGGTNPMQVGLGVGLASIDTIFTDGSFQPTGKLTDLSIQGQGFFVLKDASGNNIYTRAGNFDFDKQGNFLVPGTGFKVMGYKATSGVVGTQLGDLKVPVGSAMAPKPTSKATFTKNLDASAEIGKSMSKTVTVYDTNGGAHNVSCNFTKSGIDTWSMAVAAGDATSTVTGGPYTVTFNPDGSITTANAAGAAAPVGFVVTPAAPGSPGAAVTVAPDFSGLTQFAGDATLVGDSDGYKSGTMQNVSIDPNGSIMGRFDNGQSQVLGKVALALFENPGGLTKVGSNMFVESSNSGVAAIDQGGVGGRGSFSPGTLEMSNVDLANEFSSMIITQRGFQANSKIITVTDEMLQDLANLKR